MLVVSPVRPSGHTLCLMKSHYRRAGSASVTRAGESITKRIATDCWHHPTTTRQAWFAGFTPDSPMSTARGLRTWCKYKRRSWHSIQPGRSKTWWTQIDMISWPITPWKVPQKCPQPCLDCYFNLDTAFSCFLRAHTVQTITERLASYRTFSLPNERPAWPFLENQDPSQGPSSLNPDSMAAVGWVCLPSDRVPDRVVCHKCGVAKSGWLEGEDPRAVHAALRSSASHPYPSRA